MATTIHPTHRLDVDYTADSVEFCPHDSSKLALGLYQLKDDPNGTEESPKLRCGRVVLWDFDSQDGSVSEIDRHDMAAILDMKWSTAMVADRSILGIVTAAGDLELWQLVDDQLRKSTQIRVAEDQLALSLDWANRVDSTLRLTETGRVRAHDFPAWICAYNYHQTHTVYSGGDDCKLKVWDTRSFERPQLVNKHHMMGVCSIHSNRHREHMLATGSYDETVRIWDTRTMRSAVSEVSVGGGIWRLKWHPQHPTKLISASMHNGFHILDVTDGGKGVTIEAEMPTDGELAYGVDWHSDANQSWIASCTFYDHTMHIWNGSEI
eukprot:TRINITY_DN11724_c0_g2_i1.p1 TRINITY_DN11724_c0_g2~~TRINITY_DN11724_c0_g2_i1.p1  ORF type:complete len:322 (+),score=9.96 TRINITY_DN11724_c0_g2_i1:2-967(+)